MALKLIEYMTGCRLWIRVNRACWCCLYLELERLRLQMPPTLIQQPTTTQEEETCVYSFKTATLGQVSKSAQMPILADGLLLML
jgi:hypothetical protein